MPPRIVNVVNTCTPPTPVKDITSFKSTLTPENVTQLCKTYNILSDLKARAPEPHENMGEVPSGSVGIYVNFLVAGLRFPVSPFLSAILGYYDINIWQLHPNSFRKILCFELLCKALSIEPILDLYRYFYYISMLHGWYNFSNRACHETTIITGLKVSVKYWQDKFFWILDDPLLFGMRPGCSKRAKKDCVPKLTALQLVSANTLSGYTVLDQDFREEVLVVAGMSQNSEYTNVKLDFMDGELDVGLIGFLTNNSKSGLISIKKSLVHVVRDPVVMMNKVGGPEQEVLPPRRQSNESVEVEDLATIVTTKLLTMIKSDDTMNPKLAEIRAYVIRHDKELEDQKARKAEFTWKRKVEQLKQVDQLVDPSTPSTWMTRSTCKKSKKLCRRKIKLDEVFGGKYAMVLRPKKNKTKNHAAKVSITTKKGKKSAMVPCVLGIHSNLCKGKTMYMDQDKDDNEKNALVVYQQRNRRFSQWKGSVLDSVVGAFLTQNVTDVLSSSAYMSLASKFPLRSTSCSEPLSEEIQIQSVKKPCQIDEDLSVMMLHETNSHEDKEVVNCTYDNSESECQETTMVNTVSFQESAKSCNICEVCEVLDATNVSPKTFKAAECNSIVEASAETPHKIAKSKLTEHCGHHIINVDEGNQQVKKQKPEQNEFDWDNLRLEAEFKHKTERTPDTMDSLDYEAVMNANVHEIADAIKERGMQNNIGGRIQDMLTRLVRDHGSFNLEWLRDVPPEKTKEYLLSIRGLGLKSVECIRLLSLRHLAFPVDTNVGRIAVRLGWVPLQPLPESLQLHLLKEYPFRETIQQYLWPRLCKLDQKTLYEIHYHMITLGKVFCTKIKPNCNACPMRGECKHYASAFASARLPLPSPNQIQQERDIEDFNEDWDQTLQNYMDRHTQLGQGDMSKAIVAITSEAASAPPPKPNNVSQLRTEHHVYVLPDSHQLVEGLDKREPDDPSPYLLAVWTPDLIQPPEGKCRYQKSGKLCKDKTCSFCNSTQEANSITVCGTFLIPCRTAMRGSFPLNGTYFQVNEVFADHASSLNPIEFPRSWLHDFQIRKVYFGTTISAIVKGLPPEAVEYCFWKGFVCMRGFDRKTRAPRPLIARLHLPSSKQAKEKQTEKGKLKQSL